MNAEWRNISVRLQCGQRLRSAAILLSVPQYHIVEAACADILELDLDLTVRPPGDVAREIFWIARPEVRK